MTTDLSTAIGSAPSLGTPSLGPSTLAPSNASTSTRASFDSTSAVPARPPPGPSALSLGTTSRPATKGKGLALGTKKPSLADAFAAEMADELGDSWGEDSAAKATSTGHLNVGSKPAGGWNTQGDLMDINADQDDWSERFLETSAMSNQTDLVLW